MLDIEIELLANQSENGNHQASEDSGKKVNPVEIPIFPIVDEFLDEADEYHRPKAPESHLQHQAEEGSED